MPRKSTEMCGKYTEKYFCWKHFNGREYPQRYWQNNKYSHSPTTGGRATTPVTPNFLIASAWCGACERGQCHMGNLALDFNWWKHSCGIPTLRNWCLTKGWWFNQADAIIPLKLVWKTVTENLNCRAIQMGIISQGDKVRNRVMIHQLQLQLQPHQLHHAVSHCQVR